MKKLKWGIIATGKIAHRFATDIQFSKNAEVAAVASRSFDNAKAFADEFKLDKFYDSYEKLCQDPEIDAIYVATPHNLHYENTLMAFQNGKPVLCEKPVTVTPVELDELIQKAHDHNVFFMEGMWTYFLPAIKEAKKWYDEGRIGKILHVKADFGFKVPYEPKGRLFNPDLAGGTLYDMGIYPIAIAWYFLRERPKRIELQAHHAATGVDDDVFGMLHYDDCHAHIHSSFLGKLGNSAVIIGEKATIEIPSFWEAEEAILYDGRTVMEHYKDPRQGRGFEYQIDQVSTDIMEGKIESEIVPFSTSRYFQQQFQEAFAEMKK